MEPASRRNGIAFASGLLFALGLGISGMTLPAKVIGFLDFAGKWDPSLIFVMVGGILVYTLGFRAVARRPQPIFAEVFQVPTRKDLNPRLLGGAALFGVGWGLVGLCPGPALVASVTGMAWLLLFLASMIGGMLLYRFTLGDWRPSTPENPSTPAELPQKATSPQ